MTPAPSIDDLFHRFLESRNAACLGAVFDSAAPELLSQARKAKLDPSACEDVLQETFLTVLRRSGDFKAGQRFMPWVNGIMVKQILVERRRSARRLRDLGLGETEQNPDRARGPQEQVEDQELRAQVRGALEHLSNTHRTVVEGALLEGLSPADLAPRLGLSSNATAVRLHRGLRQIRKHLPEAATLGIAGWLTQRERGLDAVRESIQAALQRPGASAAAKTWWLSPTTWVATALAASSGLALLHLSRQGEQGAPQDGDGTEVAVMDQAPAAGDSPITPGPNPVTVGAVEHEPVQRVGQHAAGPPPLHASELPGRGRLQVLNERGVPVGAGVELFLFDTEPRIALPEGPLVAVGLTEADGTFELPTPTAGKDTTPLVYVRVDGLAGAVPVDLEKPSTASNPITTVLTLERSVPMEFHVVDELGAPIAGADLAVLSLRDELFAMGHDDALARGFFSPRGYRHLFGGVTDAEGRCTVHGYLSLYMEESLTGLVTAWVPGRAAPVDHLLFNPEKAEPITIKLPLLSTLELGGTVVDEDGQPLSGVEVSFVFRGNVEMDDPVVGTTGSDGAWRVPTAQLDQFPLLLQFAKAGYVPGTARHRSPKRITATTKPIVLPRAMGLAGHVVDQNGQPLAADLTLIAMGTVHRSAAAADGQFEFRGTRGEPAVLQAVSVGERRWMASAPVTDYTERKTLTVDTSIATATEVSFAAFEPGSANAVGIERATLLRTDQAEGAWPFLELDEGRAIARYLPAGEWSLFVLLEGGESVAAFDCTVAATEEPQAFTFPARTEGSLQVVVSGPAGLKLDEGSTVASRPMGTDIPTWVRMSNEFALHEYQGHLDTQQKDDIVGLVSGTWEVLAWGPGWSTEPVLVDVGPGEPTRVDLTAVPSGALHFDFPNVKGPGCFTVEVQRVTTAGAPPEPHWSKVATVFFMSRPARPHAIELPPGRWRWRVTCGLLVEDEHTLRGMPTMAGEVVVVAGEAQQLTPGKSSR